jgi:hypothetical protein
MSDTDDEKPKKRGRGSAKAFGREQTPEERDAEEAETSRMRAVAVIGLNWRQPGWQPTEEDRRVVTMLKVAGYTDEDIARFLSMSVESLLKYFPWEIKNGRMAVIGDLTNRAVSRARSGNDVLLMFLLKTRGGFSEKGEKEVVKEVEQLDAETKGQLVGQILEAIEAKKAKTTTETEGKK